MKLFPCLTSLSAALCAVLIFSCSSDSSDTPTPNEGISSSSKKGSGSLEDKVPNYCVYIAERLCLRGANPCLGNGIPSDDCPFPDAPPLDQSSNSGSQNGSNSSGVKQSSSSLAASSSSVAGSSSSSAKPSSSSGAKQSSSSGAKPSSANSNGSIECSGYCQWDECVRISTDPTGEYGSVIETCEEAIENCNWYSESHQIFTTSTCKGATKPSSSSESSVINGSFIDNRNGQSYKLVKIGTQTWMAENLNYNASGSVCHSNTMDNCSKYGRLYNWATAKTACPIGWHLPNDAEWDVLITVAGGSPTAGTKLKATSDWLGITDRCGTDDYGFTALPGGSGYNTNDFSNDIGRLGYWWSASAGDGYGAYWKLDILDEANYETDGRSSLFSVRCLQN